MHFEGQREKKGTQAERNPLPTHDSPDQRRTATWNRDGALISSVDHPVGVEVIDEDSILSKSQRGIGIAPGYYLWYSNRPDQRCWKSSTRSLVVEFSAMIVFVGGVGLDLPDVANRMLQHLH